MWLYSTEKGVLEWFERLGMKSLLKGFILKVSSAADSHCMCVSVDV